MTNETNDFSPNVEYPLSPATFRQINEELKAVTGIPRAYDLSVDALELDEDIPLESSGQMIIGRRFNDDVTYHGNLPEHVAVTWYNDLGIELVGPILNDMNQSAVIGQVGFRKDCPGNSFNGRLLMLDSEILIDAQCVLDDPETFGEELYDFSCQIGLADIWRAFLRGGSEPKTFRKYVDEPTGYAILDYLRSLREDKS